MEQDYRIVPAQEAHQYIRSFDRKLADFTDVLTPSHRAFIHHLPTGEVVIIPVSLSPSMLNYPSFIYKNIEAFQKMMESGYYPIPDSAKTFEEIEYPYLKDFSNNLNHFKDYVEHYCGYLPKVNELQLSDLENCYDSVRKVWNSRKYTGIESQRLVLNYSMLIVYVLMKEHNGSIEMQLQYEVYNPIFNPQLKINGNRIDVFSTLLIGLDHGGSYADSKRWFWSTIKREIKESLFYGK
jgi:hypothetical protein